MTGSAQIFPAGPLLLEPDTLAKALTCAALAMRCSAGRECWIVIDSGGFGKHPY
jgi:hypothetical protein